MQAQTWGGIHLWSLGFGVNTTRSKASLNLQALLLGGSLLLGEPGTPLLLLATTESRVSSSIQLCPPLCGIMYAVDINTSGASVSLAIQGEEKHKMNKLGAWGWGRQRSTAGDSINLLCKYLIQLGLLQHQLITHAWLVHEY